MKQSGSVVINPPTRKNAEKAKEIKKLNELVKESSSIIYETSSVFPFQLFPDRLLIDQNKVTFVHKSLFFKHTFPVLIEDINTVKVARGMFFASISLEVRGYEENPGVITHLWPDQAAKAKMYLLGIINAKKQNVDFTKINVETIKPKLEEIGKAKEEVDTL